MEVRKLEQCNHPDEALTPLFYYYDDGWDMKGNYVFARQVPGVGRVERHQLMLCTVCGTVCARPNEPVHIVIENT